MKIIWSACVAAGLQALATAAVAEPVTAPTKILNEAASGGTAEPAGKVTVKAEPVAKADAVKSEPVKASADKADVAKLETVKPVESKPDQASKQADNGHPDAGEKTIAKTLAPPPKPKPAIVIAVDLTRQQMNVSEDGVSKYTWPISSGRAGYNTPTGNYRPQWMAKMWRSRKYDDAPMPNSIFFTGGFAIHATFATGMLGRPASHGCVRLSPANAATLFKLVQARGMDRTKITVFGAPRHHEPAVARHEAPAGGHRLAQRASQPATQSYAYRQAQGYPQQRYALNYVNQQPRYIAPPQEQKNIFVSVFGSNQPQPVMMKQRAPLRAQAQQRPLYVYTQDGRMVRVR